MIPINTLISAIFLAQAAPAAAKNPLEQIFGGSFMMPILIAVMFYFLLIRPQQRQRKELAARIASLQTGDKVITSAGIHGIIHNVKEKSVVIKVAEGTMIEFDKAAVATVVKKDTEAK